MNPGRLDGSGLIAEVSGQVLRAQGHALPEHHSTQRLHH